MWNTVLYVSSGLTLAAFAIACFVWYSRSSLLHKEKLIASAPEADRAKLVENVLEFFHIDTQGLTRERKYQLAIEQINAKSQRHRHNLVLVGVIGLLTAIVAVVSIVSNRDKASKDEYIAVVKGIVQKNQNQIEESKKRNPEKKSQIEETEAELKGAASDFFRHLDEDQFTATGLQRKRYNDATEKLRRIDPKLNPDAILYVPHFDTPKEKHG